MNTDTEQLSPNLAAHAEALRARTPSPAEAEAASRRLHERLRNAPARTRGRNRRAGWIGLATATLAAVALLALPLLGDRDGTAFAAVQRHLRDFRTLVMTVEQRSGDMQLPTIRVWTDRAGDARAEIGDATTVVVDMRSRTMLTLLHAQRQALRMPLPAGAGSAGHGALDWLQRARAFQGHARRLPQTRDLDGTTLHGWSLDSHGMRIVLWADDRGMPHAVDVDGAADLHQRLQVRMDVPIDPARFSTQLPPGYTLMSE